MKPKNNKQLFYDSISDSWEGFMNQYDLQRRLHVIFKRFLAGDELQGKLLLDAGCGIGAFSERALQAGALVTSLDIGEKLIRRVGDRLGNRCVVGDVLDLQFDEASFDYVLASEVVEHTIDPSRAIAEFSRVLKPGGTLLLTCPNYVWYWSCWLANRLHIRPYEGIENWPSWRQMRRWLHDNEFKLETMRGVHLFPFVVPLLNPLLRLLDVFGGVAGPFYVNMALRAQKVPVGNKTPPDDRPG